MIPTARNIWLAYLVSANDIWIESVADIRTVSLPELVAQTNMDNQSVKRLREELSKFATWFSKHVTKYFVSEYETPSQEYVDKAKGA